MTYENPRDPNAPVPRGRPAQSFGGWLPLAFAVAVTVAVIALVFPRVTNERTEDATNTGPAVQIERTPSPSTSPAMPTPNPTTGPRPTQAPNH